MKWRCGCGCQRICGVGKPQNVEHFNLPRHIRDVPKAEQLEVKLLQLSYMQVTCSHEEKQQLLLAGSTQSYSQRCFWTKNVLLAHIHGIYHGLHAYVSVVMPRSSLRARFPKIWRDRAGLDTPLENVAHFWQQRNAVPETELLTL